MGRGNDALWKPWKANSRLSTVPTIAWKSQKRRFPHSHRPGYGDLSEKTKTQGQYGDRGKVEIQNRDFHFPTVPICLRRKEKVGVDCQEEQLTSCGLD